MRYGDRKLHDYTLRGCPFFEGMSPGTVERIEEVAGFREYEPRQTIFFPDDACDTVFWVHSGRAKVTRAFGENRAFTFRHLAEGDMLGEECLVERRTREDQAEALTDTVLIQLDAQDFRRIAREVAEFSHAISRALCRRAMDLEQVLVETVSVPVRQRIALGLVRLCRQEDVPFDGALRVTHQELADLVGTTRETATGVLHDLREGGLIDLAHRRILVHDIPALEAEVST